MRVRSAWAMLLQHADARAIKDGGKLVAADRLRRVAAPTGGYTQPHTRANLGTRGGTIVELRYRGKGSGGRAQQQEE